MLLKSPESSFSQFNGLDCAWVVIVFPTIWNYDETINSIMNSRPLKRLVRVSKKVHVFWGAGVFTQKPTCARTRWGACRSFHRRWETLTRSRCPSCCSSPGPRGTRPRRSAACSGGSPCRGRSRGHKCSRRISETRGAPPLLSGSAGRRTSRDWRLQRLGTGCPWVEEGGTRRGPGRSRQTRKEQEGIGFGSLGSLQSWRSGGGGAGAAAGAFGYGGASPHGWSGTACHTGSIRSCKRCGTPQSCTWGACRGPGALLLRAQTGTCCRTCRFRAPGSSGTAPSCSGWRARVPGEGSRGEEAAPELCWACRGWRDSSPLGSGSGRTWRAYSSCSRSRYRRSSPRSAARSSRSWPRTGTGAGGASPWHAADGGGSRSVKCWLGSEKKKNIKISINKRAPNCAT